MWFHSNSALANSSANGRVRADSEPSAAGPQPAPWARNTKASAASATGASIASANPPVRTFSFGSPSVTQYELMKQRQAVSCKGLTSRSKGLPTFWPKDLTQAIHYSAVESIKSGPRLGKLPVPLLIAAVSIAVALVLSTRTLVWPFLWDDFDFLGRAATFTPSDLLPSEHTVFYRPISRELYFLIVSTLSRGSPGVAHILHAAVVGVAFVLAVSFVRRLAGMKAALICGLFFASSAAIPLVMGWLSASQDLLCLIFALVAFHLQLSRKPVLAGVAIAAALLSKETALALVPVLVTLAMFQSRSRTDALRSVLIHLVFLTFWILIHPWTRAVVLGESPSQSSDEYLALQEGTVLSSALRGLALTLNLPGSGVKWTGQNLLPALLATGIIVLVLLRSKERSEPLPRLGGYMQLAVGALIIAGPILLISTLRTDWFTYYACIPALGFSMIAGCVLAVRRTPLVIASVLVYLWLGLALRDSTTEQTIPSELNFIVTANASRRLEQEFKRLHPSLPSKSHVYVSVQARGHGGIYRLLYRFQPLRVWYDRPEIWVLDPNRYRQGARAEFLFWITPELELVEIDLTNLRPRGMHGPASLPQYQKALRGYAFGLTAGGEVDRAVAILAQMPQTSMDVAIFDARLAAMLLISTGRETDADRLLSRVPSYDRENSIDAVHAALVEPVLGLELDGAAMRAFNLDSTDTSVLRDLMRRLERSGSSAAAGRFARRVQTMIPGDAESAEVIGRATRRRPTELTVPVPHDIPQ